MKYIFQYLAISTVVTKHLGNLIYCLVKNYNLTGLKMTDLIFYLEFRMKPDLCESLHLHHIFRKKIW